MRLLSLLFDPRGVIDRRAFWSGLIQLAVICLVVWLGLRRVDFATGAAALPLVGEVLVTSGVASALHDAGGQVATLAPAILLLVARAYAVACLMLKRLRDAGHGAGPLVAVTLASATIHALMGAWMGSVFGQGLEIMAPLFVDLTATTLVWTIFLLWLGARPARRVLAPG